MDIVDSTYLKRTEGQGDRGPYRPPQAPGAPAMPDVLRRQPALFREDWLPEGLFPEVDELRQEHLQHLAACQDAPVSELQELFAAEDAARAEALRTGGKVPAVTPSAAREDAIREAKAAHWAALARFADFIERATATFHEQANKWRGDIGEQRRKAEMQREEARAMLARADRQVGRTEALERWLERTLHPRGGRYEVASLTVPDPKPEPDLAAVLGHPVEA